MKSLFTLKFSLFIVGILSLTLSETCKSQSSIIHELKTGYIATNEVSNVGVLYEIIPNKHKRLGYELGIVYDNIPYRFSCADGSCDNPDADYETYDWRFWTFIVSAKYYLSKEHRPSRWYLGAFLLYSTEVQASISDKLKGRLQNLNPFVDFYEVLSKNRVSPGGIVGYKWQVGQHLLIEPSVSVGINVTNLNSIDADIESLFTGRIGWRF